MKAALALVLLAACGGGGDSSTVDAAGSTPKDAPKVFLDAPPVVNNMITISGTASSQGASASAPLAGVVIAFYKNGDTSPLAMATSGADGTYTFQIPTSGSVVDGYLEASKATFVDNYIYATAPLQADYPMADANMIASSDFSGLGILTGQSATNGFVAAIVVDANKTPVAGATIASSPASGKYAYADANGYPTGTTATMADGRAFYINVPPGAPTTISASKAGVTFKSHPVTARAGALTTTFVSE